MKEGDTVELEGFGQCEIVGVIVHLKRPDGDIMNVADWQLAGMVDDHDFRGHDLRGMPLDPYHSWNQPEQDDD